LFNLTVTGQVTKDARAAVTRPRRHDLTAALLRAILDARQITVADLTLPHLMDDLRQVFDALLRAGADLDWFDPRFQQPLRDQVKETKLRQLLR
jgi:hypothetical protein